MPENKRVHPPIPKREKRVGIYCRVSTSSVEQLQSLTAQVSHLTRITAATPQWLLADVYMDIATSKTVRPEKNLIECWKIAKLESWILLLRKI